MQSLFMKSLLWLSLASLSNSAFSLNTSRADNHPSDRWTTTSFIFNPCQNSNKTDFTIRSKDGQKFYCHSQILKKASQFWRGMLSDDGKEKHPDNIRLEFSAKTIEIVLNWAYERSNESALSHDIIAELLDYVDMSDDLDLLVSIISEMKNWPPSFSENMLFESNFRRTEKLLIKNLEQATSARAKKIEIAQPMQLIAFLTAHHKIFFDGAQFVMQKACDEINQEMKYRFIWHAYGNNPQINLEGFHCPPDWCDKDWQAAKRAMRDALSSFSRFQNVSCEDMTRLKETIKQAVYRLKLMSAEEAHSAIGRLFYLGLLVLMSQDQFQDDLEKCSFDELPCALTCRLNFSKEGVKTLIGEKTWQEEIHSQNPYLISIRNLINAVCAQ